MKKISNSLFIMLISIMMVSFLYAQTRYERMPDDLETSKVIFLKYEKTYVKENPKGRIEKIENAYRKKHNKIYPKANAQLEETAKKYPFEYIIAKREEIDKYKAEGYKYVLDSELLENLKEGIRSSSSNTSYHFDFYLEDLTTGDIYVFDDVPEGKGYYAKEYMSTFIRKVKRQYKLK